jgi:hypothetical protein
LKIIEKIGFSLLSRTLKASKIYRIGRVTYSVMRCEYGRTVASL